MTQTQKTIEDLRPYYIESSELFEFKASMFLAGKNNTSKRQDIIQNLTGKRLPATKASLGAVVNALKNTYDSPTLF